MSQSTGANATDDSGSGYDLVAYGTPTQIGGGLITLNPATTDYYSLPHASCPLLDFTDTDTFTLIARVKANSSTMSNQKGIISKWGYLAPDDQQYVLFDGYGSTGIGVSIRADDGEYYTAFVSSIPGYTAGTDYINIAGVWNGYDLRVYINGTLIEDTWNPYVLPSGTGINDLSFRSGNFEIGRRSHHTAYCANHTIDYAAVFNYGLTQGEIQTFISYWK
jgi:hypothetical protein